jgi:isopenicillin N synthase-like dioxygenase
VNLPPDATSPLAPWPAHTVPVVDIGDLASPSAGRAIDRACRDWGFFQITGHGIPSDVSENLFAASKSFFSQPTEVKRQILRDAGNPWGFYDRELTKNTLDWKQVFDYGPADGAQLVPRWPQKLPDFRAAVLAYYAACESLAFRLLSVLAANLGMPATSLDADFSGAHTSFVRLNYYPTFPGPQDRESRKPLGISHHTDAGALTILLQDAQPGLEVCRDGKWFLVEPRADALVVNIGDVAQVWSNDRYRAALHRVVTSSTMDRYSAPFFFNPGYDANYAPLPTTVDANNPARYRPINWREFREQRAAGDYADYGNEVQISDYRIPTA